MESDKAGILEITAENFFKLKDTLYEKGGKKDFLIIESIMRRSYLNKKATRI